LRGLRGTGAPGLVRFRSTRSISAANCFILSGFVRYESAPAARQRSRSPGIAKAVTANKKEATRMRLTPGTRQSSNYLNLLGALR